MSVIFDKVVLEEIKRKLPLDEYVSQYVDLQPRHGWLYGLCPFHNEDTPSFAISKEMNNFHCFGCKCGGDIFTFIMKMDNLNFKESVEKASSYLGIKIEYKEKSETLEIVRKLANKGIDKPNNHKIISKAVYDKFPDWIEESWVEEGIDESLFKKYEIKLDSKSNRVIYPVYDSDFNFINIKGRTKYADFKSLKIAKYMNYYKVGTMDYLQGLHLSKPYIEDSREVIIFEGIKSCMKAEGFGYLNTVAAETCSLTKEQIGLLITLHCDVVIAFDKDKVLSDYYSNEVKMLTRFTNVYYIDDKNNLLGDPSEKNSPVDISKEVWDYLYENRKRVR